MKTTRLGPLHTVSRLTLGGGGLGQIWGNTSHEEAVATVHAALDAGITLIDTAPLYQTCETVIADTFRGRLPDGVRITTKCQLGEPPRGNTARILEASLDASLRAMALDFADVYFLHSNICEDDMVFAFRNDRRAQFATPWSIYVEEVVPAMEALKRRGRIGAWGITGVGVPSTILKALGQEVRPDIIQAVSNLLDSAGGMRAFAEPARPRDIIARAVELGIGVMSIRAVQAGALTSQIDRTLKDSHPEARDFERAAPFRALCETLNVPPAALAHRYALDMAGVDTVVLGVKNRVELAECVAAEAAGTLPEDLRSRIDGLGLAYNH